MNSLQAPPTILISILRTRIGGQDVFVIGAAMFAAALFAFEYDFFQHADHMTSQERRITVLEFFCLTGLLIVGLIAFSMLRLSEQRREFERRLVAESAAREARGEALRDPLTGLPNRRALFEALHAAMRAGPGAGRMHALVLFDLNRFKSVNDSFGHPAGDGVLQAVGRRMLDAAGPKDLAARLGGDEFALFCREVREPIEALRKAQGIIAAIERPIVVGADAHSIGAAAGVAIFPLHGEDARTLVQSADLALYRAKAEKVSAARLHRDT